MESCCCRCPHCGNEIIFQVEKKISYTDESVIDKAVQIIKQFEGFKPKAFWDYKQWTNGYGTKAKFENEVITREEAEKRLFEYVTRDYYELKSYFKITPISNFLVALLSFSYNLGRSKALLMVEDYNNGNSLTQIAARMKLYIYAGGKINQGLKNRREAETKLFLV